MAAPLLEVRDLKTHFSSPTSSHYTPHEHMIGGGFKYGFKDTL